MQFFPFDKNLEFAYVPLDHRDPPPLIDVLKGFLDVVAPIVVLFSVGIHLRRLNQLRKLIGVGKEEASLKYRLEHLNLRKLLLGGFVVLLEVDQSWLFDLEYVSAFDCHHKGGLFNKRQGFVAAYIQYSHEETHVVGLS